jgi:hypothetical protein
MQLYHGFLGDDRMCLCGGKAIHQSNDRCALCVLVGCVCVCMCVRMYSCALLHRVRGRWLLSNSVMLYLDTVEYKTARRPNYSNDASIGTMT